MMRKRSGSFDSRQTFDKAQELLAICYDQGDGVDLSPRSALTWGLKAAKQNNSGAQHDLGLNLIKYYGRNATGTAIFWLRKAAGQGEKKSVSIVAKLEKAIDSSCAYCGVKEHSKKRCSRCRNVSYCSADCQRKHWKKGGHKKFCCNKDMDIQDFQLPSDDYISHDTRLY